MWLAKLNSENKGKNVRIIWYNIPTKKNLIINLPSLNATWKVSNAGSHNLVSVQRRKEIQLKNHKNHIFSLYQNSKMFSSKGKQSWQNPADHTRKWRSGSDEISATRLRALLIAMVIIVAQLQWSCHRRCSITILTLSGWLSTAAGDYFSKNIQNLYIEIHYSKCDQTNINMPYTGPAVLKIAVLI